MNKKIFLLGILFFLASVSGVQAETKTVNAVADTFSDSQYPTDNFGTLQSMMIRSRPVVQQGFVKFNYMSFVPMGSIVQSARLKIYNEGFTCDDIKVYAQRVTSNWSELSLDYQNSPNFTSNDQSSLVLSNFRDYETWDVTKIVKGWLENRYLNYGFKLYYYTSDFSDDCYAQLLSRETDKKPLLEITYTEPSSPLYDIKSFVTGSNVNISWKTEENSRGAVYYRVFRSGTEWKIKSSSEVANSHSVRISGLQANTRYEYKIYSRTVSSQETTSNIQYFQTTASFSSSASQASQESADDGQQDEQERQELEVYNVIKDVLSPTSVRIKWWSNVAGTSWALISDSADDSTPNSEYVPYGRNDEVEVHEVFAEDLASNTTYSYKVLTRTVDNQVAISARRTFTTYGRNQAADAEAGEGGNGGSDPAADAEDIDVSQDHFETGNEEDPGVLAGILQEADSAQEREAAGDLKSSENKNGGTNPENSEDVFANMIPFFLVRVALPILFWLVIIALIIFLVWRKRHKKDVAQETSKEATKNPGKELKKGEIATEAVGENVSGKSKSHTLLWVIGIIFLLAIVVFLKNLLTLFIPMPF